MKMFSLFLYDDTWTVHLEDSRSWLVGCSSTVIMLCDLSSENPSYLLYVIYKNFYNLAKICRIISFQSFSIPLFLCNFLCIDCFLYSGRLENIHGQIGSYYIDDLPKLPMHMTGL